VMATKNPGAKRIFGLGGYGGLAPRRGFEPLTLRVTRSGNPEIMAVSAWRPAYSACYRVTVLPATRRPLRLKHCLSQSREGSRPTCIRAPHLDVQGSPPPST
jgi:hypothetical protein